MKGICFKEPLFHKTVKREKIHTRRLITPQPEYDERVGMIYKGRCYGIGLYDNPKEAYRNFYRNSNAPKYKVGETVYLKEPYLNTIDGIAYRYNFSSKFNFKEAKFINKLFMPESAARHFIKITAVRAERLQDISEEDCIKEGIIRIKQPIEPYTVYGYEVENLAINGVWFSSPRQAYASLINRINGKGTWESNPWVWVYEYELIEK